MRWNVLTVARGFRAAALCALIASVAGVAVAQSPRPAPTETGPSDVLAGYAAGLVWVSSVALVDGLLRRRGRESQEQGSRV
jgi:hypothetical protein